MREEDHRDYLAQGLQASAMVTRHGIQRGALNYEGVEDEMPKSFDALAKGAGEAGRAGLAHQGERA